MKNDNQILHAAREGYDSYGPDHKISIPYLYSSPCYCAYRAGFALAATGRSRPVKAAMSRGYAVKLQCNFDFIAKFSSDLQSCQIERV